MTPSPCSCARNTNKKCLSTLLLFYDLIKNIGIVLLETIKEY
jgi:hypothetical protein